MGLRSFVLQTKFDLEFAGKLFQILEYRSPERHTFGPFFVFSQVFNFAGQKDFFDAGAQIGCLNLAQQGFEPRIKFLAALTIRYQLP